MISPGDLGIGAKLGAFADCLIPRTQEGKPFKTSPNLINRTERERRYLARRILDYLNRGATLGEAAKRGGVSPSWVSNFCKKLPETDPLRKRYERLNPRQKSAMKHRYSAQRVVELMEKKLINAKAACLELGISSGSFYSWVKLHRDTKLYKRYELARDNAPNWRKTQCQTNKK